MKTQKGIVFLLTLCCCLLFCSLNAEAYGLFFYLFGAEAKVCVTVVDADGKPVENALTLATYRQYNWGLVNNVEKLTDENGYAELVGRCDYLDADVVVKKEGCYETRVEKCFKKMGGDINVKWGKWHPYGEHLTCVLKEIRNPVPMVVFWRVFMHVPEIGKEFGFDLECGDFVKPYGDGEVADFQLKIEWEEDDRRIVKKATMTFPNALDGAYVFPLYRASKLQSPYHADMDAEYKKEFVFYSVWVKEKPGRAWHHIVEEEKLTAAQGMILRTRTKVDANGTLVSAHFSKLYGELATDGFTPEEASLGGMSTYFNPVENDTNLEYDGKRHRELQKGKRENTETEIR